LPVESVKIFNVLEQAGLSGLKLVGCGRTGLDGLESAMNSFVSVVEEEAWMFFQEEGDSRRVAFGE
jgi:hypothetical protein